MIRIASACLCVLALVACEGSPVDPATPGSPTRDPQTDPIADTVPPVTSPVAQLDLTTWPSQLNMVGTNRSFTLRAYDAAGRRADLAGLTVISSDTTVGVVSEVRYLSQFECDTSVGVCWKVWEADIVLQAVGSGVTTVTAALRGASDSASVSVQPVPTAPAGLVIDSFTVIEYRPSCGPACTSYAAYVPLVWMREPQGSATEFLEAMSVTVPTLSTGWWPCDAFPLAPGATRRVNESFDPYLWNNDFFLFAPDGPVPAGLATLRVIVSDEEGRLRIAEASAPIERNGTPPSGGPGLGC